jgi:hypothetical protein
MYNSDIRSQESERSCICVLGISNLPISTIFLLNVWNFSDIVIFFFSFYYRLWKKNYDDVPATGPRTGFTESSVVQSRALRGGSSSASVRGPESQERARESLKCPMDFILICSLFLGYFQLKSTRMTGYLPWDWWIFTEILKWTCTKQWKCSYLPRHEGQIFDNFKIFLSIAIIMFDEMQNGAIWGHFRVSYNIESSTILMIDKNILKLSKICPSCLGRYEHFHYFV